LPASLPANGNILYKSSAPQLKALSPAGDLWWSADFSTALPVNLQDKSTESPK